MLYECPSYAQTGLSVDGIDAANLWCVLQPIDRHLDHSHEVCCVLQGEVRFHGAAVLGDGVLSRRHGLHRWTRMLFRMPGFARNRRRVVDKWKKLRHIVSLGSVRQVAHIGFPALSFWGFEF